MYVSRNIEALSCNHCCCGKAMSITLLECVCVCLAIGIQHVMRMRLIFILVCPVIQYFSTFSHKRQDCRRTRYGTRNVF